MKQLAQYQDGRLELQEIPKPRAPAGGVLVRVTRSVISPGTERMKVEQAKMSLLQKARARPDQVRKVLQTARTLGWKSALEKVRNRLGTPTPLGYSLAGVVEEVDELCYRYRVGDRVACGGAECAHHAEYVAIPEMLVALIPDEVSDDHAAFTTLASIAMQGVRQADVRLGENVAVIGQGLVGLLVTGLSRAAGANVIGVDVSEARLKTAREMGAVRTVGPSHFVGEVLEMTGGVGVDHVILCIGGREDGVCHDVIEALRDRGRITIVGMFSGRWEWKEIYERELEIRYARSYGPGRYDSEYEWGGADYPVGYVRWTEQRHFQSCLELMRSGGLQIEPLVTGRFDFCEAPSVYERELKSPLHVGMILRYGSVKLESVPVRLEETMRCDGGGFSGLGRTPVVDVVGAGNFARTMLLPSLKSRAELRRVVNRTSLSAEHVRRRFGFLEAATDVEKSLSGGGHDAVVVATRHDWHAPYVLEALRAGLHVFVEKPLCLSREEMEKIRVALSESSGSLMVGFNRRFAPATVALKAKLAQIPGPKALSFHVNAGELERGHWYGNIAESGGRILGEACHFLDWFGFLLGASPIGVRASYLGGPGDSFQAQLSFADGSGAQLIYSARGNPRAAKEVFRVSASGYVCEGTDFRYMTEFEGKAVKKSRFQSKGHVEEVCAWVRFLREGGEVPILDGFRGMEMTFDVLDGLRGER